VGVVADVRYRGLTSGDPARLVAAVHAEVRQLDPRAVIDRVTTMQGIVDKETAPWRFSVWVLTLFGAIAFVLAGLGLFGLVSLDVAERDREFAIRLALGAQRRDVIRAALSVAGWRVLAGLALGIGAAAAAARSIRALLFGVTPLDVTSFAAGIGLVLAVVAFASYLPARRAAAIEPLVLLRRD
jgi:ABC-type antimicrobial peptide transport system permease subunit